MAIVYGLRNVANISIVKRLLAFTVVSLVPVVLAASPGVILPADEPVQIESLSSSMEVLSELICTDWSAGSVTAADAAGKTGARLTTVNASNFLSTEMFATFLSPYTIAILSP